MEGLVAHQFLTSMQVIFAIMELFEYNWNFIMFLSLCYVLTDLPFNASTGEIR